MSNQGRIYCLDSNVLIQAWQKYYSPKLCPSYWDKLNQLGTEGKIFISQMVFDELTKTDDDLSKWVKESNIEVKTLTADVTNAVSQIYAADPLHKFLVDNKKGRSLADPWVIAHAIVDNAVVVTKEEKVTAANNKKGVKIPNVCDNMNIPWMTDFEMLEDLEITFTCE
jgi:predicted nucleic acid-binding protein